MIVSAIYHGLNQVFKIYHDGKIIFRRNPVTFHVVENGKLIILGALSAVNAPDGVYLDCIADWTHPEVTDGVMSITRAYTATQNGSTLEVG